MPTNVSGPCGSSAIISMNSTFSGLGLDELGLDRLGLDVALGPRRMAAEVAPAVEAADVHGQGDEGHCEERPEESAQHEPGRDRPHGYEGVELHCTLEDER